MSAGPLPTACRLAAKCGGVLKPRRSLPWPNARDQPLLTAWPPALILPSTNQHSAVFQPTYLKAPAPLPHLFGQNCHLTTEHMVYTVIDMTSRSLSAVLLPTAWLSAIQPRAAATNCDSNDSMRTRPQNGDSNDSMMTAPWIGDSSDRAMTRPQIGDSNDSMMTTPRMPVTRVTTTKKPVTTVTRPRTRLTAPARSAASMRAKHNDHQPALSGPKRYPSLDISRRRGLKSSSIVHVYSNSFSGHPSRGRGIEGDI